MTTVEEQIATTRVVPVVVLDDAALAADLGRALVAGNLPIAEVTFRTAAAEDSIRAMAENPDLLVGAGTVVSPEQVDIAADAGARFIVSPGFLPAVVQRCRQREIVALPGTVTATEVMMALEAGVTTLKFFPASTSGGAAAIKAMAGPFAQIRFVPTGGISPDNLAEYLTIPGVTAVGGSWMVPKDAIAAGDFDRVTALCAEAVRLAATVR